MVGVIPKKLDGNWYDAPIVIRTLKNQPFKPSRAMGHSVETSQNVIGHQQAPIQPIMVIYTDGGPDHRTHFITVILSAVRCGVVYQRESGYIGTSAYTSRFVHS
jgi:hypothetical protein